MCVGVLLQCGYGGVVSVCTTDRSLTPNLRIPHEQVSSASDCIRTPHHHSHTATEHQHTSNQVCDVQIQYSGDIITTCYTKHSITIRHHGSQYLRNTLSNTAIHIKTNKAIINGALTQYLYTSYRYNP